MEKLATWAASIAGIGRQLPPGLIDYWNPYAHRSIMPALILGRAACWLRRLGNQDHEQTVQSFIERAVNLAGPAAVYCRLRNELSDLRVATRRECTSTV